VLEPDGDLTKAIRALTRAREDLVAARTGIVNQLRAELERFWPGPLRLFSHMDAEIFLAFLERYPSPADAHGLGVARMQAFLVQEHYCGGQHPTALMAKLRSAPRGRVGELELAARRRLVLSFVAMVRTLNAEIKDLEREIRTQVRAHPDGPIFLSLFKSPASVITAAELLAEIGDCRERYPDRDALATDAGQAAVAKESGKWKAAGFRRACNKRLRVAFWPAGRQQPPLAHLGPCSLRAGSPARSRTPPRNPDRRPRMVPSRLAMLAQPRSIRPHATPRTPTPHHRHYPNTVGPRARPRCNPADGRHRCHPTGGPHGPSAKRLTGCRRPLLKGG
jgi:transposase